MKPFTTVAVVLFLVISLVQLLRVVNGWEVTVAGKGVPPWVSIVACIVAASMALLVWRENRR